MKWIHTHRLTDGPGKLQDDIWDAKPDELLFSFGGKYGTQFKTLEEVQSFISAFDDMLKRKGIDKKHTHPLLYLIMFLGEDAQQQSIEINRENNLHDYAQFILNLIADSLAHIAATRKNPAYEQVYDIYTQEIFFAKKELVATISYEELIEYYPKGKQADDVIKYLRIAIYEQELYIPEDLVVNIRSNKDRKLKSFSGKQEQDFQLPVNLQREVFTYMISNMLDSHKRYDTQFYKLMISDSVMSDFKPIFNKYKKHTISNTKSLARLGTIIKDYLLAHKLIITKRDIATFLFEYFALFKAIRPKQQVTFPTEYNDLIPFYIQNRVNGETIRNMMKDVGEI